MTADNIGSSNPHQDKPYVGRFAPTPNGPMHAGTAAAALLAHSHAKAHSGRILLRWDDLDPLRCSERWIESLRADMTWLGLTWDGEVRQTAQQDAYRRHLIRLAEMVPVYPCTCSRTEVRARTGGGYDGRCRPAAFRSPAEVREYLESCRNVRPGHNRIAALRIQVADAPGGDPVVWSAEGYPSYTFACAVDEADLGITHVVRGADLDGETGPQSAVLRALGLPTPTYVHFPVVADAEGKKLSKSGGAAPLRERWGRDAASFREWVGRGFFDPSVSGEDLPAGWRGRLKGEAVPVAGPS